VVNIPKRFKIDVKISILAKLNCCGILTVEVRRGLAKKLLNRCIGNT
jgi:hypothetical protein